MSIGASGIRPPRSRIVARPLPARHRPNPGASAEIPQPIAVSSDAGVSTSDEHEDMPKRDLDDLEHIAEVGESDKTLLILLGDVWVASAIVVLAVLAVSLLAYRLAS
jgi:hypothetical protein